MPHICVSKLTIIGSDNGWLPARHQAIIWIKAGILLIQTLGTNFSEILNKVHTFVIQENAFENVVCKMMAILFQPKCVKQIIGKKDSKNSSVLTVELPLSSSKPVR